MRERKNHKGPSAKVFDFFNERRVEFQGKQNDFISQISLGAGSIISKIVSDLSPYHISGPKYSSKKWLILQFTDIYISKVNIYYYHSPEL